MSTGQNVKVSTSSSLTILDNYRDLAMIAKSKNLFRTMIQKCSIAYCECNFNFSPYFTSFSIDLFQKHLLALNCTHTIISLNGKIKFGQQSPDAILCSDQEMLVIKYYFGF